MRDLVPWPGMELGPLRWDDRVLATGPPGSPLTSTLTSFRMSLSLTWGDEYSSRLLRSKPSNGGEATGVCGFRVRERQTGLAS